jgi:hypothetical protein
MAWVSNNYKPNFHGGWHAQKSNRYIWMPCSPALKAEGILRRQMPLDPKAFDAMTKAMNAGWILAGKAISQDVPLTYATIALSAGVTIGGILPTPGGLGGVEAGIFSTLLALGYDAQSATTIAILYRSATYWQPLLPGTIAYFYLKSKKQL